MISMAERKKKMAKIELVNINGEKVKDIIEDVSDDGKLNNSNK